MSTLERTAATPLNLELLRKSVSGSAVAIRCRTILQPAAGPGTKVFPPTHAGGVYATEKRRIPVCDETGAVVSTREADCVLLDSVQSQANRIEDALQQAIDDGRLEMPLIEVDFTEANKSLPKPISERITSLTVPHRLPDAILRDSEVAKGVRFKDSEHATKWAAATLSNATPIFELCPTALVLGMWGSPEKAGGTGNKFGRALVSEIVGIDALFGVRTGSRIDPLSISSKVQVINEGSGRWRLAKEKEKGSVNPSEIGHSNIPPSFSRYQKGAEGRNPLAASSPAFRYERKESEDTVSFRLAADFAEGAEARQGEIAAGGATIAHAEHTAVLSFPQLRRLRFPLNGALDANANRQSEIDNAARTVLAALSLVGLTLSLARGCDLRSRCLLFPEGPLSFELLETPGKPTPISLDSDGAIAIYKEAVKEAAKLCLPWETKTITLTPSPELIALVKKSQELAATDGDKEGE